MPASGVLPEVSVAVTSKLSPYLTDEGSDELSVSVVCTAAGGCVPGIEPGW